MITFSINLDEARGPNQQNLFLAPLCFSQIASASSASSVSSASSSLYYQHRNHHHHHSEHQLRVRHFCAKSEKRTRIYLSIKTSTHILIQKLTITIRDILYRARKKELENPSVLSHLIQLNWFKSWLSSSLSLSVGGKSKQMVISKGNGFGLCCWPLLGSGDFLSMSLGLENIQGQ